MKTGKRALTMGLLAIMIVLGTVGTAFAGTININLKPHVDCKDLLGTVILSHRDAATICVYGPNGYYRSKSFASVDQTAFRTIPTVSFQATNAPIGAYRVRVIWQLGGGRVSEANQYPGIGWWFWQQNPTVEFVSP